MERDRVNDNEDVFTLLLVKRGQLNATTTNATVMTATTTITMSNVNANASDENEDDGREDREVHKPIPRDGLPTRTRDG